MNPRLARRAIGGAIDSVDIPPAGPYPKPIFGKPLQLTPIPWRKPDRALARVVLRHIAEVTPPTVIPHNPLTEQRMHSLLRSLHIAHH